MCLSVRRHHVRLWLPFHLRVHKREALPLPVSSPVSARPVRLVAARVSIVAQSPRTKIWLTIRNRNYTPYRNGPSSCGGGPPRDP